VGEQGVEYKRPGAGGCARGPAADRLFGPGADKAAPQLARVLEGYRGPTRWCDRGRYAWGAASSELVKLIYGPATIGMISTDRNTSHLAEQLAIKSFVPLIAILLRQSRSPRSISRGSSGCRRGRRSRTLSAPCRCGGEVGSEPGPAARGAGREAPASIRAASRGRSPNRGRSSMRPSPRSRSGPPFNRGPSRWPPGSAPSGCPRYRLCRRRPFGPP